MRLLPKSLMGQTLLAAAGALLVAQAISATLLYQAAQDRREAALINAAAFQLVTGGTRAPRLGRDGLRRGGPRLGGEGPRADSRGDRIPRRTMRKLRFTETEQSPVASDESRDPAREQRLSDFLTAQGINVGEVAVTIRPLLQDDDWGAAARRSPRLLERAQNSHGLLVAGLRREGSELWQVVRLPIPKRDGMGLGAITLQTLVLFVVLLGLLYLMLRRITGPLADLRGRTEAFSVTGAASEPLPVRGPQDVAGLTSAHNAMEARITAMLDEKDVMLGAIGHDLKTPLAALRVRIESVADEKQRTKMSDTIEDITRTLDEILDLARIGRNDTPAEHAELSALATSIVEEFEDTGKDVTLTDTVRAVAPVHLTWLKRGLRNLIANAVRYARAARVSVKRDGTDIVLVVEDDGPGIPADEINAMLEPFSRGEASRNRATGGAGLGLTIARAVAEQHGGSLVLSNRLEDGRVLGLRAEIRLPAG
ncbi:sensor histidine kinase [Erythrobacter sp. W53]|uniref:sensor histidine kinase n=1 Tax=Erythrobacter sp. W53 TaxID=3425947 RepID=UPI003D768614